MPASNCDDTAAGRIEMAPFSAQDVRVYSYGVRIDPECVALADDQIRRARRLYNEIVARMRAIYAEMQSWVLDRAGEDGRRAHAEVESLTAAFAEARSANDESAMKDIAAQRRAAWAQLSAALKSVRSANAAELRERFYSRIGTNSSTDTYRARCEAVEAGLGWATANDVLARALVAWKTSMKLGRPPQFMNGAERDQDSLVLQFTSAGGLDVQRLFDGSHAEVSIGLPAEIRPRRYGTFRYRLGAAAANAYATGTIQVDRAVPPGSASVVRLVRRRHGPKMKWALQIVVRLRDPVVRKSTPLRTLACVHFGWATDTDGRRVAGISDGSDPGLATLVQLPTSIEEDLTRASEEQAARDRARDEAVPALRELCAAIVAQPPRGDDADEALRAEADALRRLPSQHVAARRFYGLASRLRAADVECPLWLSQWIALDRKRWQASVGIARRARNRRRQFYRDQALRLAREYSAIVIEPLDLKAAAAKVDEDTGERSTFGAKARSGRVVAALFEFEQEIRKSAGDYGVALFEMTAAPTASRCAFCGSDGVVPLHSPGAESDRHEVSCPHCGAVSERKLAGAAVAWQIAREGIEDRIVDYHAARNETRRKAEQESLARKEAMAAGRRAARLARAVVPEPAVDSARNA